MLAPLVAPLFPALNLAMVSALIPALFPAFLFAEVPALLAALFPTLLMAQFPTLFPAPGLPALDGAIMVPVPVVTDGCPDQHARDAPFLDPGEAGPGRPGAVPAIVPPVPRMTTMPAALCISGLSG